MTPRAPYDSSDTRLVDASRTTRWRAQKRGWWCPGYREREIILRPLSDTEAQWVLSVARRGATAAVRRLNVESLSPFELDDLVSEATVRLCELAGHKGFGNDRWGISVTFNTSSAFIRTQIFNRQKEESCSLQKI